MLTGERCARHPGAAAGWRCRACGAALCPGCTYLHRAGPVELPACARCRGLAEPITLHRGAVRSFPARIPAALVWPFHVSGLLALLGLGAVLWLLWKFSLPGAILGGGVWWAFVFNVIRRSAAGADDLGPPDFSDVFSDLVVPMLRGVLATAVIWVPALAYLIASLSAGATPAEAVSDPVVWLLGAAGVAYGPVAVLIAGAGAGFLALVNPLVGLRAILRLGRDYWAAALTVGALLAVNLGVRLAAGRVEATGVPFLSAWIAETMTCVLPIVAARVLGVLLYVRGDDLGLGEPGSYLEPVLGDAVPRGSEPVLETQAAPEPEPEPVRAIDLDEPPAPPPPAPPAGDPLREIDAAIAAGDGPGAVSLFAAYRGPDAALPARTLFQVARVAAAAGQHGLAARALHTAGTGADAAVAPNALLVLSRVYERRLARPADAAKVLDYLVRRWPESDAARQAREALRARPAPPAA